MKSLSELFPRASKSFHDANPQSLPSRLNKTRSRLSQTLRNGILNETRNRSEASGSIPKQSFGQEPLDSDQGKTGHTERCILRYTSRRCRLLDEDNWCTKYFTDALRYCGALSNDTPDKVTIQVRQEKVAHRSQEETIIEIEIP